MDILVIGGNRYFGKRLIALLRNSGHRVTVLNRGSSGIPGEIEHVIADRDDENALESALAGRFFDVVVDQVCYTPHQAEIARRVFADRTRRYVMTSTVMVYEHQDSPDPVAEDSLDLSAVAVDTRLPWGDPGFRDAHYGEGKRQAEAVFAAGTDFAWTSVRVAHVLGGDDDFTGRLDHYVRRVRAGEPIAVPAVDHPATYVHVEEIAAFLAWTAVADFTGPVNAHSHGPLTAADLCAEIERQVGGRTVFRAVESGEVSPFSFTRSYGMDNSRATALGYSFSHSSTWLARAVAETVGQGAGHPG
ncbi:MULTISPECIES: NAD-dependent epimerase/dehydratase family protein [unclassified Streptomyces]|uniref:NAD-dependent epimerase/dehydratase family protein n=1 Tax=unclassified Streptomyces TaxID=2593676 RepID=UPI0016612CB3|nr:MULTISPECIES: NAD-dependent epimerase/dehydratase family protein [unclassified Streptomyces]MBD0710683.1 reductase [Streptomyces sp. CBMA291]MBD0715530.1 reductase [Streptomyces sp. CBMA370]